MIEGWQFNNAHWAIGVAAAFMLASVWFFFRSLKREGKHGRDDCAACAACRSSLRRWRSHFLRPERVLLAKRSEQPRVAVLWDGSGSMATRDVVTERKTTTLARGLGEVAGGCEILGAAGEALPGERGAVCAAAVGCFGQSGRGEAGALPPSRQTNRQSPVTSHFRPCENGRRNCRSARTSTTRSIAC